MKIIYYILSTRIDKEYFKRVWMKYRLYKSVKKLNKSSERLKKAREERIWIENDPSINLINYPYKKLMRLIINRGSV